MSSTIYVSLGAALILAGCGEADGPTDDTADTRSATLEGRSGVDTANDGALSGSVATAYQVGADGQLTELSSAEVDAQGRYAVEFDVRDEIVGRQQLVVELADASGDRVGGVALERVVADGGVYTAAPIDDETSAEARVLVAARGESSWREGYPLALLRQSVDADLAAQLQAADDASSYDRVAVAVTSGVRAHYDVLAQAEADRDAIDASLERAELELDAELDAAADLTATQQARAGFTSDVVAAYDDAGVTFSRSSQAFQARAEAATRASAELDSAARARLIARVERDRAAFTGRFVEDVTSTPASARATLDASLAATADAGATAEADADAAWDTYSDAARSNLDADLGVAAAAALDGLFVSLEAVQGAYFDAVSGAEGSADAIAEVIVDAQADARADFGASANLDVLVGAGLAESDAQEILELTYQLSLTGEASVF